MRSRKINSDIVTYIFSFIIPITPWYASIMGISAINLICLLYVVMIAILRGGKFSWKKIWVDRWVMYLFTLVLISRFFTFVIYGDYLEPLWFTLRTAVVFTVFASSVKNDKVFLNVIKTVLIASFLICIFGLIEEIIHFNIFTLFKPADYELNYNSARFGLIRILSFTEHTIVYSVYLMFCLGLCAYYIQFVSSKEKLFYRVLYFLLWINIALSLSRSAMICTFLSQLLILYFRGEKQFILRIFKISAVTLVSISLLSLLIPQIGEMVNNILYMILAVFNDDFTSIISSTFGGDNLYAQGDRLNLYKWVLSKMDGGWIFGHGKDGLFSYSYPMSNGIFTWIVTKENIEVQYLDVLFRYGIFGMITSILLYLRMISLSLKKKIYTWDKKLSFNKVAFSLLFFYYLQLFAVNQTSERSLFYIILFLIMIYNGKSNRLT